MDDALCPLLIYSSLSFNGSMHDCYLLLDESFAQSEGHAGFERKE